MLINMTEEVYGGSFCFLGIKIIVKRKFLNFTHDALHEMCVVFQKWHWKKNKKQLAIFKSLPQPFGLMYFH